MSLVNIPAADFASVCESGDTDAITRILSLITTAPKPQREGHVRRLNTLPPGAFSPVHWACFHKSPAMLTALLAAGLAPNLPTRQPLQHPTLGLQPRGTTPLHAAATANAAECARMLLELGPTRVDLNARNGYALTPIFVACAARATATLEALLAHEQHKPDPMAATERAIEPGAPDAPIPWPRGANAVMAAAAVAPDCLSALLANFADHNARDDNGYAAAHYAAQFGTARSLRMLATAGADLDARTSKPTVCARGSAPLHVAVRHCRAAGPERARWLQCIGVLLQAGAPPSAGDARGFTALHCAIMQRDCGVVRLIVDASRKLALKLNLSAATTVPIPAKPGTVSQDIPAGTTPYALARLRQAFDCAEVLVRHLRDDPSFADAREKDRAAGRAPDALLAFIEARMKREDALAAQLVAAQGSIAALGQLGLAMHGHSAGDAHAAHCSNSVGDAAAAGAAEKEGFAPAPLPMPAMSASAAAAADAEAAAAVLRFAADGALASVETFDPFEHYKFYLDAAAAAPSASETVALATAATSSARGTPLMQSGAASPFVNGFSLYTGGPGNEWSLPATPHGGAGGGSYSPWTTASNGGGAPAAGAGASSRAAPPSSRVPLYKPGEVMTQIPLDGIDGAYADAARGVAVAATSATGSPAMVAAMATQAVPAIDAESAVPAAAAAEDDKAATAEAEVKTSNDADGDASDNKGKDGGDSPASADNKEIAELPTHDADSAAAAAAAAAAEPAKHATNDDDDDLNALLESGNNNGSAPAVAMGAPMARARARAAKPALRPIVGNISGAEVDDGAAAAAGGAAGLRPGSLDDVEAMQTTSTAALLLPDGAVARGGKKLVGSASMTVERSAPVSIARSSTTVGADNSAASSGNGVSGLARSLKTGGGGVAAASSSGAGSAPRSVSGLGAALRGRESAGTGLGASTGVGSFTLGGGGGHFNMIGGGAAGANKQGRSYNQDSAGDGSGAFAAADGDPDEAPALPGVGSFADTVLTVGSYAAADAAPETDVAALQRQVRSLQKKLADARKRGGGGAATASGAGAGAGGAAAAMATQQQHEQTVAELQRAADAARAEVDALRLRAAEAEGAREQAQRQARAAGEEWEAQRRELAQRQGDLTQQVRSESERGAAKDERIKQLEKQVRVVEHAAAAASDGLKTKVAELEARLAEAETRAAQQQAAGGRGGVGVGASGNRRGGALGEPLLDEGGSDAAAHGAGNGKGAAEKSGEEGCCCTVQ